MDDTPFQRPITLDTPEASAPPPLPAPDWEDIRVDEPLISSATRVRSVVRELLETAIFILLIFFIVRGIVQNFKIEGSSMEPNLHTGEYILVNKLVYFHFDLNAPLRLMPGRENIPRKIIYPFHLPRRGDIIVFEYPNDPSKDYIKRVIGLPGDIVEIRTGEVFVNSKRLDEPFLQGITTYCNPSAACNRGPVAVKEGTLFVMGDNRTNSSDSREWGELALDRVIGQAWMLYYPFQDMGVIQHHTYPE